jgi:hypothetical protein
VADAFGLLCAAVGDATGMGTRDRIRAAVAAEADWPAAIDGMRNHRVTLLATTRMLADAGDLLSEATHAALLGAQRAAAARGLAAAVALGPLMRAFGEAGVRALPFKGPALSLDAYGDPAMRECDDLDIVVVPEDLGRAHRALIGMGYAPAHGLTWRESLAVNGWQGHVPFVRAEDPLPVELHWRFTDRKLPWTLPVSDVLARAAMGDVLGVPVPIPEIHDQLVLVLLHAARHGWDQLEAAMCASALLRRGVDPGTFLERARAAHGVRACLVGLALAGRVVGAPVPSDLSERAVADPACARLVERAITRLREADAGHARDATIHLAALDGAVARARYVMLGTLLPTMRERDVVSLPVPLTPLYVPIRLARLVANALRVATR